MTAPRPGRATLGLLAAAFVWSALLVVGACTVTVYSSTEVHSRLGAPSWVVTHSATLVGENGLKVLVPVGAPLVVSVVVALVLWHRAARGRPGAGALSWTLVGLLATVAVLGVFTIGPFLVPVAGLLGGACGSTPPAPVSPPAGHRP